MPHMTVAYPFEWAVLGFAQGVSEHLSGGIHPFLLTLTPDGAARHLTFSNRLPSWHDETEQLNKEGASFLFYDPFDWPEYCWLEWTRVPRATMERLVGHPFTDDAFVKTGPATDQAPDLKPANTYPESWGVMF